MKSFKLVLSPATRVGHGEFADVIRVDESHVVKLFRRVDAFDDLPHPPDNETMVRIAWDEECKHYELLQSMPELEVFSPRYFGRCFATELIDDTGRGISSDYVPDCALELEFVPGRAKKVWQLPREIQKEVSAVCDRFQLAGLRNTGDASVFVPGSRAAFTLIDFASLSYWLELYHHLRAHRRLPDHIRTRWES